jgi:hypothetical protein
MCASILLRSCIRKATCTCTRLGVTCDPFESVRDGRGRWWDRIRRSGTQALPRGARGRDHHLLRVGRERRPWSALDVGLVDVLPDGSRGRSRSAWSRSAPAGPAPSGSSSPAPRRTARYSRMSPARRHRPPGQPGIRRRRARDDGTRAGAGAGQVRDRSRERRRGDHLHPDVPEHGQRGRGRSLSLVAVVAVVADPCPTGPPVSDLAAGVRPLTSYGRRLAPPSTDTANPTWPKLVTGRPRRSNSPSGTAIRPSATDTPSVPVRRRVALRSTALSHPRPAARRPSRRCGRTRRRTRPGRCR